MSNPKHTLFWMTLFLVVVVVVSLWLSPAGWRKPSCVPSSQPANAPSDKNNPATLAEYRPNPKEFDMTCPFASFVARFGALLFLLVFSTSPAGPVCPVLVWISRSARAVFHRLWGNDIRFRLTLEARSESVG